MKVGGHHFSMKVSGATVPALWAFYNGIWLSILAGFRANSYAILLYCAAIALVELFAIWVVLRRDRGREHLLNAHGEAAIAGAVAILQLGEGGFLGKWMYPTGIVTAIWAITLAVRGYRTRPGWKEPLEPESLDGTSLDDARVKVP